MSHELRTPLNAIIGFSDLILDGQVGELKPQQREFLEAVLRNGKHLLSLINSVLDLSKIEAGRMTLTLALTDLREAIMGAVADTASLRTAKRQECHLDLDAPLTSWPTASGSGRSSSTSCPMPPSSPAKAGRSPCPPSAPGPRSRSPPSAPAIRPGWCPRTWCGSR